MDPSKADIIARLNQDILPLQGYKPSRQGAPQVLGLGAIENAFPNKVFPLAAIHEFCCKDQEDETATGGFISGLLASLLLHGGTAVWISQSPIVFPPAMTYFGLSPEKFIFISMQKEKDIQWAMEEALKCGGLSAVIGEIKDLSFTASRRFQLAVENSNVTGFIIRRDPRPLNSTASVTRWKISSLPSESADDLPGIGFPRWQVDLLKVRNGRPGSWKLEWIKGKFRLIRNVNTTIHQPQKKTG